MGKFQLFRLGHGFTMSQSLPDLSRKKHPASRGLPKTHLAYPESQRLSSQRHPLKGWFPMGITVRKPQLYYPLVNVYITMENHHVSWCFMGKSTINGLIIFYSYVKLPEGSQDWCQAALEVPGLILKFCALQRNHRQVRQWCKHLGFHDSGHGLSKKTNGPMVDLCPFSDQ